MKANTVHNYTYTLHVHCTMVYTYTHALYNVHALYDSVNIATNTVQINSSDACMTCTLWTAVKGTLIL